jgi:prepilin-type N-terminal cleavage/methylation domain-containing protein
MKNNKKKGFNLIEVLVAMSIIMLLTGGILIYFNDFNSRQKVEGARIELIGNLKLARNYAVTRQKINNGSEVEYVYVKIDNNGDPLKGQITVDDQNQEDGLNYFKKFLSDGKPEVSVELTIDDAEFCFEVYSGKVKKYDSVGEKCSNENIEGEIKIALSSDALDDAKTINTKTVVIDSSGLIYEKDEDDEDD